MKEGLYIKLSYVPGLGDIVKKEVESLSHFKIVYETKDSIYINNIDNLELVRKLRTVSRAYLVSVNSKYNPLYISNHKSVLGNLIQSILDTKDIFKTFKISCAGSSSPEIVEIKEYVVNTFKLIEKEDADIKIHIAKIDDFWEVGVQITSKPLSVRDYKINNMSGAMDPTIAYSLNNLCNLENKNTYLNIFSGSATLMIEAGLAYPNLDKIVGFDNNKEHLSLSIQNIKKAGLLEKLVVKERDIFNDADLGNFDVITSDLPFGMVISKNEDLEKLYTAFIKYCENSLNAGGVLGVYTSQFEIFEKLVNNSKFKIIKEYKLDLITSEEVYLPVKIIILTLI